MIEQDQTTSQNNYWDPQNFRFQRVTRKRSMRKDEKSDVSATVSMVLFPTMWKRTHFSEKVESSIEGCWDELPMGWDLIGTNQTHTRYVV